MTLYMPPTNKFIFWIDISNHLEIKKKLFPIIINKSKEATNNNNYKYPEDKITFTSFRNTKKVNDKFLRENYIIKNIINECKKYLKLRYNKNKIKQIFIKDIWFNNYNKDDYHQCHSHNGYGNNKINNKIYNNYLSFVYIFNDATLKNSEITKRNNIAFLYEEDYLNNIIGNNIFESRKFKTIKEGTILIFDPKIKHYVSSVKKDCRITISGNAACVF